MVMFLSIIIKTKSFEVMSDFRSNRVKLLNPIAVRTLLIDMVYITPSIEGPIGLRVIDQCSQM